MGGRFAVDVAEDDGADDRFVAPGAAAAASSAAARTDARAHTNSHEDHPRWPDLHDPVELNLACLRASTARCEGDRRSSRLDEARAPLALHNDSHAHLSAEVPVSLSRVDDHLQLAASSYE